MTTALPLRDPQRTRRLLERFDTDVCRFSILTRSMLDRLHREFTPEELGGVDLALVNKESKALKANVGRFRARAEERPRLLELERDKRDLELEFFPRDSGSGEDVPTTIACVSGFLINMLERRIRLVSPCPASERWPLGFVVYADRRFRDGADFRRICERLVAEHMYEEWPAERPVRFRPTVGYRPTESGFEVSSRTRRWSMGVEGREAYCRDLGDAIAAGEHRPGEIVESLLLRHFVPGEETDRLLGQLLRQGVLDEEPPPELVSLSGGSS